MVYDKQVWQSTVNNGQIPSHRLRQIDPRQFDPDLGGPARLHPEAAEAMGALLRQAWSDGARWLRVKYSYRTLAKQWEKWRAMQNGGNLAARPGTSNHGWAVAVDFTGLGEDEVNWLRRKARNYGYVATVPGEIWHYDYQEHIWEGSELTEEEKKLLRWLSGFEGGITANLAGADDGRSVGNRVADAVKHSTRDHAPPKHIHIEGRTGKPIGDDPATHDHREGRTGPPVAP